MGNVTSDSVGFRPLQAAHDLFRIAQRAGLDTVVRLAKGVPSAEMPADVSVATLHALINENHCRISTEGEVRLHETLLLAATLPDDDFDIFLLATMILLADRLQLGRGPDDLYWHWDAFSDHYRLAPPLTKAAIINGFREAERLGVLPSGAVAAAPVTGVDVGRVRADLRDIARSASVAELTAIANADHGDQAEAHLDGLRQVIHEQGCVLLSHQGWVPSEVIELSAHTPENRGFLAATSILLVTAMERGDDKGWFDYRWEQLAIVYDSLPSRLRWAVLAALRYLYETDPCFEPYPGACFDPVEHRARLIPMLVVADRPD